MTLSQNGPQSSDSGKDYHWLIEYMWVLGVVFFCTGMAYVAMKVGTLRFHHAHTANVVMVYLLGVLVVALNATSRGPALFCAFASVLAFDYCFVERVYSFIPEDRAYVTVVIGMFITALIVNELALRARKTAGLLQQATFEKESEKLKNTLLRSVSHDLKTPLAAIMGASSTLLSESSNTISGLHKTELTKSIYEESERLERLVSNLLEITRLESGGLAHKEWNAVEDLIGSTLSSMERRLVGHDVQLEIEPGLPLLEVDDVLMGQVFANLLDNCLRYAPSGKYKISACQDGKNVVVTVCNTGSSIGKGEEERVFEKFYRARTEVKGCGLGLAICRGIVQLHGGSIRAESGDNDVSIKILMPISAQPMILEEAVV